MERRPEDPVAAAPAMPRVAIAGALAGVAAAPAMPRVAIAGALAGVVAYCVALHALILSGAWPTVALALIVAPWLGLAARPLARAWRGGSSARRASLALSTVAATVAGAWVVARVAPWLDARVDAVLYVENLAFFAWLAWLFAASVVGDREPLVTRLARRTRRGDMPPSVVRYTRFVTIAWAAFFVAAMAISTLLYFTQARAVWSLFVNLLLWPLAGLAMGVEYLLRLALLRDVEHVPFSAAIHAFRTRSDDA